MQDDNVIGEIAVAIYSAIADALGPELTRKANASLRDALDAGYYSHEAACILYALCNDDDIDMAA